MVLNRKSSQECAVDAGVPQVSILGIALFLLHINDLPNVAICNIAICADDITFYFKCNQASGLQQKIQSAKTWIWPMRHCGWGRKCLVDFNAEKLSFLYLTSLITLVLLMWKQMGLLLKRNHLLRCWSCLYVLNYIRLFYYLYCKTCVQ